MRPSVVRAFFGLLWFAFAFTAVNTRVVDLGFSDKLLQYNYLLKPRQDNSCGTPVACSPCDPNGCGASKLKQRSHLYDNVLSHTDISDTNFTLSEAILGSEHQLAKRVFGEADQGNIGEYLDERGAAATALGLDGFYANGSATSFTRQLRFQDYITTDPPGIIMGTGEDASNGVCGFDDSITSSRGHFWQPYGFLVVEADPENPTWMDGPNGPNLIENVLNLIGGNQPLYYAQGDALDVSLFNQDGDLPYAYVLAPRYPGANNNPDNPDPAQIFYYWNQIQQIATYVQGLLPNLQAFLPIPYIAQGQYPADELYRGQALFEYDPDADGNKNGNWRLFYEESSVNGRSVGQDVVGVNKPT